MSKINFFLRPQKVPLYQAFSWLRLEQKKKTNQKKKLKVRSNKKQLLYRLSFRQQYKKFLTTATDVKLKYLLQDLIKKYFSITVSIKVTWPLIQFKNLKFYRLLFPEYRRQVQHKKTFSLKISKNNLFQQKKYIYIGQPTHHLKFSANSLLKRKYMLNRKQNTANSYKIQVFNQFQQKQNFASLKKNLREKK